MSPIFRSSVSPMRSSLARTLAALSLGSCLVAGLGGCATTAAPQSGLFKSQRPSIELSTLCLDEAPEQPLFTGDSKVTRILILPLLPLETSLKGDGALEKSLASLVPSADETLVGGSLQSLRLPCTATNHEQAREIGNRLQADLVIWGAPRPQTTGVLPFSLRITLLERARKLREDGADRWAWGEVTELDLDSPGSDRTWLASLLFGLHSFRLDQGKVAAARIEQAIKEARDSGVTQGLHPVHALLGWAAFLGDSPLAAQAALRLAEEEARAAESALWEAIAIRGQADVASARGDIVEARRLFDLASERFRALDLPQGEADCLMGHADLDVQISDLASARRRYKEALEVYGNLRMRDRQAGAYRGLGEVAMWVSDYPAAEQFFSQAHLYYSEQGIRQGEGLALQRMGDVRLWQSDLETAQSLYDKALTFSKLMEDRNAEANLLMSLGNVRRMSSEYAEAIKRYNEALAVYRELGDELGQANALRTLGDVLALGTSYDDARFSYDQAITLYKARTNLQGEAASLRGLAWLERSFGVGYARRQYEAALFLSHKAGDKIGAAHSRLGLGQLAVGRQEYFEAKANFERAGTLYKESGYLLGEALARQGMAETAWGLKDISLAKNAYQEALTRYRTANLRTGEMQCHLAFGQAAMRANDLKAAAEAYEGALKVAQSLKDRQGEADSLFLMARLKVRQGKSKDAVVLFQQTRDAYKALGVTRNFAIATADLGTLLLSIKEEEQGKALLEEASTLFEQIGLNGEAESCRSLIVVPPALTEAPASDM